MTRETIENLKTLLEDESSPESPTDLIEVSLKAPDIIEILTIAGKRAIELFPDTKVKQFLVSVSGDLDAKYNTKTSAKAAKIVRELGKEEAD